ETRQPLNPYIVVRGIKDTVATAGELRLVRLRSGTLFTRAILAGYLPKEDTLAVVGDREQRVVIALDRVRYGELRGNILDAATHQPLAGRIAHRGVAFGEQAVGDSGRYRFRNLPAGEYRVGVTGPNDDYVPQACTLRVETGKPTERDFYLVKKRMTIVLEGVNFETGKADILPQFVTVLDRAGQILKQTPDINVELAGHTDPREINTPEFPSNWELSRARAEAVRRYLVDKFGIAPERLTANGYADTQPIAPNDSPQGMARNRRTEFRILEE
ncbi:OmpA family protein, partial [candidate division WOR-3 bacterium]|nr:OmpA family protein [candidate division WOR-3 bacterium]